MNNTIMDLVEKTNNLLKSMNILVESSIKDIESLQYEVTFSRRDTDSITKTLSNASSKYLLNELIKSIQIIEDALLELGFKSSDKYPKFNAVDNKEMDDIEFKLQNMKKDVFFNTDCLKKIKELDKEINDIESFMIITNRSHGQYTISKKSKIKFLKSSKNRVTFGTVFCLDEKLVKFYDTLNALSFGVYRSLKKEKAKLMLEREELKI